MNRSYTPKQIEKYKRQKYISALNKCTKNLYKIFKSESSTYSEYQKKFKQLKDELLEYNKIRLDTEHLKISKEYIDALYKRTVESNNLTQEEFQELKIVEASALNRLQKIKNRTKYNKMKHKDKID